MAGTHDGTNSDDGHVKLLVSECAREYKRCLGSWKCIRVPAALRKGNPEAYTPVMFNLGPYSLILDPSSSCCNMISSSSSSSDARNIGSAARLFKVRLLKEFIMRDGLQESTPFEELVRKIAKEYDSEIGATYIDMPARVLDGIRPTELACLLALDGVAIVGSLIEVGAASSAAAPVDHVQAVVSDDAMLLENQIPLFVLQEVLEFMQAAAAEEGVPAADRQYNSLLDVLKQFYEIHSPLRSDQFKPRLLNGEISTLDELPEWRKTCLLHHLYVSLTEYPGAAPKEEEEDENEIIALLREGDRWNAQLPGASRLAKCGVRFQASTKHNFSTGVDFDAATLTLTLPQITVSDDTPRVLLNLLAYEVGNQRSASSMQYYTAAVLTSYICFMSSLTRSAEDADVLVQHGVVINLLSSSEELASVWKKIQTGVAVVQTPKHCRANKHLVEASRKRWRTWLVTLKETYLFTDCLHHENVVSVFAAACLLVLAFLQTVYTMKTSQHG